MEANNDPKLRFRVDAARYHYDYCEQLAVDAAQNSVDVGERAVAYAWVWEAAKKLIAAQDSLIQSQT